jgi:hypothetical protein
MTDNEWQVPPDVLAKLNNALGTDGFRQPIPGLFVKDLDEVWRAWISLAGCSVTLIPSIGVFSEELLQIARAARAKLGRPAGQPPDTGPPLIMANLEQIIGHDPCCQKHMSWHFEVEDRHIAKPPLVPELKTEAVDDLAFCLRSKAYPFFAAHMTYRSIWDAIRTREAMPSPAIRNYFPIVLIKLGRRADVPRFVDEQVRQIPNERIAMDYKEYVDAILAATPV